MFEINYELEDINTKTFYGVQNQNFNLIKSSFPTLKITGRDNFIFAMGNRETLDLLKQKLDDITAYISKHNSIEIKQLESILKLKDDSENNWCSIRTSL
jgi:phosphate starvation-inducible PhoH-like protein